MFEEKTSVEKQAKCPFRIPGVVGYLTAAGSARCKGCGEIHPVVFGSETRIVTEPDWVRDGRGR